MHGSRLARVCVISCLTDVRGFTEGDRTIVVGVREENVLQICRKPGFMGCDTGNLSSFLVRKKMQAL